MEIQTKDPVARVSRPKPGHRLSKKPHDVDGGWAWMILFGVTLWNFIIGGSYKIMGVLYVEFLDLFQAGPVTTSYLGLTFSLVAAMVSTLGGYCADNMAFHKLRVLLLVSGLMAALGTAAAGYMPTFAGTIVSFGVITAFFGGFCDPPSLSLLGLYFDDRRTVAASVAMSGDSLATLVLPPLLTVLVQMYTLRGAMLLYAGLWLHALVIPAMMLPIKSNYSQRRKSIDIRRCSRDDITSTDQAFDVSNHCQNGTNVQDKDIATREKDINRSYNESVHKYVGNENVSFVKDEICLSSPPQADDSFHHKFNCTGSDTAAHACPTTHQCHDITTQPYPDNSTVQVLETQHTEHGSLPLASYISNKHGVILTCIERIFHFFHSQKLLFQTQGIIPLSCALFCGFFGSFNMLFVLPPLAQELGLSKLWGSLLIALPSITEVVARVIMGTIVDKCNISKVTILMLSYIVSGSLSLVVTFFDDPDVYVAYAVVYGLLGGMVTPLCVPMLMDIVRVEQHGAAVSLLPVLQCIPTSIGPPVLSAIAAHTGSFVNSLRVCAGAYFLGFIIYMCNSVLRYIRLTKIY